jgi:signal peptidase I
VPEPDSIPSRADEARPSGEWPWYVRAVVGRNPLFTLIRAIIWAVLLVVIFKFVLLGIRVHGESMEPTFHNGQVKVVNRLAYARGKPHRGDVVAVRAPGLQAVYLKRIVALPGEHLTIRGGRIYINGEKLNEPYAHGSTSFQADTDLEPNQYFVIGDNRDISDAWLKWDYQIIGKLVY